MAKLKLTYFDIDGGRAEPARIAFSIGGIKFEDNRFGFDKFSAVKPTTPLGQVPTLTIDDRQITQCNAINRFAAKLAGLYPASDVNSLVCDEVMDIVEECTHKLVATFGLEGEALQVARTKLAEGAFTNALKLLNKRIVEQGGLYICENRLTIADLKVFVWVHALNSGILDHIPTDLVDLVAPQVHEHYQRVAESPGVIEYYAKR
ncbi:MAG: glutathione S-transferase [Moraxellaceae bacterium]|nr:MAG: glutathione S-transferase [Moraxellaceae bacterium]